ncbi:MAG TPA: sulfurtransferase [Desulfobacterales bacterium]|nr:sulfurtransferase [Desulfobacterales bacterium]
MNNNRTLRYFIIAVILFLGVVWSLSTASDEGKMTEYPNHEFLVSAKWLKQHITDNKLVILDVRADKYYDGSPIPGAIRLPWTVFRYDDVDANIREKFVGPQKAQEILGNTGIARSDDLVLYDSVERDGGATASFVFWVLDILGHSGKKILDRGIDAWKRAGYDLAAEPRTLKPLLYQAPFSEIEKWRLVDGPYVYSRLGDPMYQIIDVRSHAEYVGEKGSTGLRGTPFKLGHIPKAVNINYTTAWVDEKTKQIKTYRELQELYRGLDTSRGVIVYCDSGRRSSFSYFVLRLMGINQVITYEHSWQEWGDPEKFFPVETTERKFSGDALPGTSAFIESASKTEESGGKSPIQGKPKGGYVSCGG